MKKTTHSKEERMIYVAKLISSWRSSIRQNVSIDAKTYNEFFQAVPILHTVHDQSGNPHFILVNKDEAIRICKETYNLKSKEDILKEKEGLKLGTL